MSKTSIQSPVLSGAKGLRAKEDQTGQSQDGFFVEEQNQAYARSQTLGCIKEQRKEQTSKAQEQIQACLENQEQTLGCTQTRGSKGQNQILGSIGKENLKYINQKANKGLKTSLKYLRKSKALKSKTTKAKITLSLLTLSLLGASALSATTDHSVVDYSYHTIVNKNTYYQVVYQSIDNLPGGFIVLPDGKGRKRGGENNRDFFIKGNFLLLDIDFSSPTIGNSSNSYAIKVESDAHMHNFTTMGIIEAKKEKSNGIRVESNADIGTFYNKAGGTISGVSSGILLKSRASIDNFINNGTIRGDTGLIALGSNFSSDNIFLNSGLIGDNSSKLGMYVKNAHMSLFSNTNSIQGSVTGLIINNDNLSDTLPNFINTGNANITGTTLGMLINNDGTISNFYNSGTINTSIPANGQTGIHIEGSGTIGNFINKGTISGTNKGIVLGKNSGSANAIKTFTNSGIIKGSEAALDLKGNIATFYNTNLIQVNGTTNSINSYVNGIWSNANIDMFYNTGTIDSTNQGANDAALRVVEGTINNFINNGTLSVSNASDHTNSAVLIKENASIKNFVNASTIKGDVGVYAKGKSSVSNVFLNSGTIGDSSSKVGVFLEDVNMNNFSSSGTIEGTTLGMVVNNNNSNNAIKQFNLSGYSNGTVKGTTLGMLLNNAGTINTFNNYTNTITGDRAGIEIFGGGTIEEFKNFEDASISGVINHNQTIETFFNAGTISNKISNNAHIGTFYNQGIIQKNKEGDSGQDKTVIDIKDKGSVAALINTGDIKGDIHLANTSKAVIINSSNQSGNYYPRLRLNGSAVSVQGGHIDGDIISQATNVNIINDGTISTIKVKDRSSDSSQGGESSSENQEDSQENNNQQTSSEGSNAQSSQTTGQTEQTGATGGTNQEGSSSSSSSGGSDQVSSDQSASSSSGTQGASGSQGQSQASTHSHATAPLRARVINTSNATINTIELSSADGRVEIINKGTISNHSTSNKNTQDVQGSKANSSESSSGSQTGSNGTEGSSQTNESQGIQSNQQETSKNLDSQDTQISSTPAIKSTGGTHLSITNDGVINGISQAGSGSVSISNHANAKISGISHASSGSLNINNQGTISSSSSVNSSQTEQTEVTGGTNQESSSSSSSSGGSASSSSGSQGASGSQGGSQSQTNSQASTHSNTSNHTAILASGSANVNITNAYGATIDGAVTNSGSAKISITNNGTMSNSQAKNSITPSQGSSSTSSTSQSQNSEVSGSSPATPSSNGGSDASNTASSASQTDTHAVITNAGTGTITVKNNKDATIEGIKNNSSGTITVSNEGSIENDASGHAITNDGSGSIEITNHTARTNSATGKINTLSVGGSNVSGVKIDTIRVDQSNLDVDHLNNITNLVSGLDSKNIKNVKTNGGGEIKINYDSTSGRLSTDIVLNASIAGAIFRNLTTTNTKRTAFVDEVMKNTMAGFSLDKTQKLALNRGEYKGEYKYDKALDYDRTISSRFNNEGSDSKALASNLYADASNILASSNIGEASDFLLADTRNILPSSRFNSGGSIGGSALDYRGSLGFNTGLDQEIKEHAFMILPYFSSLSTELSLNEESKGHTKGVISAYSTLKESGIYGLYAGYEDTSMESTYFDVKNRTYYGGLRYFTSLYGGSLNESLDYELYLRAGGKAAFIKNNVLKKIDTNKAGAKPNTYAYGANVDMGLNFILDSHVFSPELGLVYEGSYTKAYTMNNLVGGATVHGGERMYKNQYNLFSTKASVTWFEDWLPHLKTSLELGAKFNLNPTITFKGRFGSRKASEEIELASVEGFLNAALILPLNPSFYMSLNYSGMSSSKDTIHTGFAQFSYLW